MIKLGSLQLGENPRIAAAITDRPTQAQIVEVGVDVLEIRVDMFSNPMDVEYVLASVEARAQIGIPLILTVRNMKSQGGQTEMSDARKSELFQECIHHVDAVDIECQSPIREKLVQMAHQQKKIVIISTHHFDRTPPDTMLDEIFKTSSDAGADIIKIAAQTNMTDELYRLLEFTFKYRQSNVITMALGELGSISRLVFPSMGSLLTYSYIGKPSAPGQLPVHILKEHFQRLESREHFSSVNKNRKLSCSDFLGA